MWVLRGLKKGVLTTDFPKKVSKEEMEMMSMPKPDKKFCSIGCSDVLECIMCRYCEEHLSFEPVNEVKNDINLPSEKSIHVFFVDAGSCNACNREIEMLNNPYYDFHRFGIFFTPTPRHADVLLVAGFCENMVTPLLNAYNAMPDPKIVIAVGKCASTGSIYNSINSNNPNKESNKSGLDSILPVDIKIPGCPPSTLSILRTLVNLKKT